MLALALLLSAVAVGAAAQPEAVAERIQGRVDELRRESGLTGLDGDERLREAARNFAGYMARTGEYGHRADGRTPAERAGAEGYEHCIVSENIARAYDSTGFTNAGLARQLVRGWVDSPEHRDSLLDPWLTETGVAVARSGRSGRWYAVQMFGRPKSMRITFEVANQTSAAIGYRLGDRRFRLPPRIIRSHADCRPQPLRMDRTAGSRADAMRPVDGERFVVVEGKNGPRLRRD